MRDCFLYFRSQVIYLMKPFFWMESPRDELPKPLTLAAVKDAESKLHVKLPPTLVELLMERNGGRVRYDGFPGPEEVLGHDDCLPLGKMMGIYDYPANLNSILMSPSFVRQQRGRLPENIVLVMDVADGSGHGWIALDYRTADQSATPSVIWIDEEIEVDVQLAEDFQSFIDQLVIYTPYYVYGFSQ